MAAALITALAFTAASVDGLAATTISLTPTPVLYVYDHCPFCVRARLALGLKGVRHDVRFMANDDIPLPTSLVGKKIAPIWDDGSSAPYAESLDIVRNVDADERYGPTGMFREMSDRTDLKAWQKSVQQPLRLLQRPRYVKSYLPEFVTRSSKDAFVKAIGGVDFGLAQREIHALDVRLQRAARGVQRHQVGIDVIDRRRLAEQLGQPLGDAVRAEQRALVHDEQHARGEHLQRFASRVELPVLLQAQLEVPQPERELHRPPAQKLRDDERRRSAIAAPRQGPRGGHQGDLNKRSGRTRGMGR